MGIVYERINGQILSEYLSRNLKNAHKIVHKFARTQKIINNINSENIPNHTNKLKQRITNSSLLCDSEKKIILKYLKIINKNEICHGDYHPENIFVDENYNFRVIDWANMFVSNKYMDVARTYYLIKLGKSLNGKSRPRELVEWLGRQFITKLYWEKIKTEENRNKYFLPCLFIVILIRYDENIELEKKWIHNYVMMNKKEILENMYTRKDIN
jgi:aminoglycoside phosphotransferase